MDGADGSFVLPTTPRPSLLPSLTHFLLFFPPFAAVRTGNLAKFNQVLDQFGDKFQADGTYTLIIRLRHNVIKTGRRGGGWEAAALLCMVWGSTPVFPPPQVSA